MIENIERTKGHLAKGSDQRYETDERSTHSYRLSLARPCLELNRMLSPRPMVAKGQKITKPKNILLPFYRMCRALGRATWIMIIDTAPVRPIKANAHWAPQRDAMNPRTMLPTVSIK